VDDLSSILDSFRELSEPRFPPQDRAFRLSCQLDPPTDQTQIDEAWGIERPPSDLVDLWKLTEGGRLFEDVDYGQWGLVLLSPKASAEKTAYFRESRREDALPGDVVAGEFLGDSDLLVLQHNESGPAPVLIALPLDERTDWYSPAAELPEFLRHYRERYGQKYWEGMERRPGV
jgi:hypothetical protein